MTAAVSTAPDDASTAEAAPRDTWLGPPPLGRRDALVAALVGLLATAFALWWRSPIVPTDPWHYVRSALEFPSQAWVSLGFTRYGMILPIIPVAEVFGNAEITYYFWPMVSVFVLTASLYLLGRRFWNATAGVVAVVALLANTIILFNLSRGYPDIMSMALIFAAAVAAVLARDRGRDGRLAAPWVLLAGFLLGWGFEVRETGILAWPFVLAILWKRGALLRTAGLLLVPLAFWAALDVGISGLVYGDPLLKLHTLIGTNPTGVGNAPPPSPIQVDLSDRTRVGYFLSIPLAAIADHPDGVWWVVLGVVAVLALFARNRALRLAAFGFVSVYVLNLLAGGVLVPSRPFGTLVNPRYWIQYFPFLALVLGGIAGLAVAWLGRRLGERTVLRVVSAVAVGAVVVAVPVTVAARYLPTVPAFAPNDGDVLEDLRAQLAAEGVDVDEVWTDWNTKRILPAYQRPWAGGEQVWEGTPMSLTGRGEPGPGDLVLIHSGPGTPNVCGHCRNALWRWQDGAPEIPDAWQLVWSSPSESVRLYEVP